MDEVTTTEDVTIDVEEAAGVGDMEIETEEIGGGTTINKSSGQTLFICSVMGGVMHLLVYVTKHLCNYDYLNCSFLL